VVMAAARASAAAARAAARDRFAAALDAAAMVPVVATAAASRGFAAATASRGSFTSTSRGRSSATASRGSAAAGRRFATTARFAAAATIAVHAQQVAKGFGLVRARTQREHASQHDGQEQTIHHNTPCSEKRRKTTPTSRARPPRQGWVKTAPAVSVGSDDSSMSELMTWYRLPHKPRTARFPNP
jgi:hypothetical protein